MELLQIEECYVFALRRVSLSKALEKGKTLNEKPERLLEQKVGLFSSLFTMEVQKQEKALFNNYNSILRE